MWWGPLDRWTSGWPRCFETTPFLTEKIDGKTVRTYTWNENKLVNTAPGTRTIRTQIISRNIFSRLGWPLELLQALNVTKLQVGVQDETGCMMELHDVLASWRNGESFHGVSCIVCIHFVLYAAKIAWKLWTHSLSRHRASFVASRKLKKSVSLVVCKNGLQFCFPAQDESSSSHVHESLQTSWMHGPSWSIFDIATANTQHWPRSFHSWTELWTCYRCDSAKRPSWQSQARNHLRCTFNHSIICDLIIA